MMTGAGIDVEEIVAIEILIQALKAQAKRGGFEISHAESLLRKYIESHLPEDFERAKKAFDQIGMDLRTIVQSSATEIANQQKSHH